MRLFHFQLNLRWIVAAGWRAGRQLLGAVAPAAMLTPDLVANGTGTATVNSQMLYRTAYIGVDLNVTAWAVGGSFASS